MGGLLRMITCCRLYAAVTGRPIFNTHLTTADDVGIGGQHIDHLALALVAPLGAEDYRHLGGVQIVAAFVHLFMCVAHFDVIFVIPRAVYRYRHHWFRNTHAAHGRPELDCSGIFLRCPEHTQPVDEERATNLLYAVLMAKPQHSPSVTQRTADESEAIEENELIGTDFLRNRTKPRGARNQRHAVRAQSANRSEKGITLTYWVCTIAQPAAQLPRDGRTVVNNGRNPTILAIFKQSPLPSANCRKHHEPRARNPRTIDRPNEIPRGFSDEQRRRARAEKVENVKNFALFTAIYARGTCF